MTGNVSETWTPGGGNGTRKRGQAPRSDRKRGQALTLRKRGPRKRGQALNRATETWTGTEKY